MRKTPVRRKRVCPAESSSCSLCWKDFNKVLETEGCPTVDLLDCKVQAVWVLLSVEESENVERWLHQENDWSVSPLNWQMILLVWCCLQHQTCKLSSTFPQFTAVLLDQELVPVQNYLLSMPFDLLQGQKYRDQDAFKSNPGTDGKNIPNTFTDMTNHSASVFKGSLSPRSKDATHQTGRK